MSYPVRADPRAGLHFCLGVGAVVMLFLLARIPFSGVPYFGDELGWYVRHAIDVFDSKAAARALLGGAQGKVPLLEAVLFIGWHVFGYSIPVTRWLLATAAATAIVGTSLVGRSLGGASVGVGAGLLLAAAPPFFLHGTSAVPEALVVPALTAAIALASRRRLKLASAATAVAVCAKVTAVLALPGLIWLMAAGTDDPRRVPLKAWLANAATLTTVAISGSALYFLMQSLTPGVLVLPSPDVGKVGEAFSLHSVFVRSVFRFVQFFVLDCRWLLSIFACGALVMIMRNGRTPAEPPPDARTARPKSLAVALVLIIAGYVACHVFLGWALLTRYLIPALPALCVLGAFGIKRLCGSRYAVVVACVAALSVSGLWLDGKVGNYTFKSYDDHLGYLRIVESYRESIRILDGRSVRTTVAANYPGDFMLSDPRLGYTRKGYEVRPIPASLSEFDDSGLEYILLGWQVAPVPPWVRDAPGFSRTTTGAGDSQVWLLERLSVGRMSDDR